MKALIVEDDIQIAEIMSDLLSEISVDATKETTIDGAFSAVGRSDFDIYLLDYHIGQMNTVGLSHYIKIRTPHAPIVLVTGSTDFRNGEHFFEMPGVDVVLRKPFRADDLKAVTLHRLNKAQRCTAAVPELEGLSPVSLMFNV